MRAIAITLLACSLGCSALEPAPPPPQEVRVRVTSDPGRPLRGASVLFNGQKVSESGDDGVARLKLTGRDGEVFDVTVSCPEGHQSPSAPLQIPLKRLADPKKTPEYEVSCPPSTRTVVVAVRAEGGPNLPILYLGREIARTDGAGAAHVMLKLKPDESFDLVLSTRDKQGERLRPQNPTASFVVKDRDEVLLFDQRFDQEKKKPSGGRRRGPVKIGH